MAAACVHLRKGRPGPAGRLFALALEKLEDAPEDLRGIPASALVARTRALASELASGAVAVDPAFLLSPPDPPRTG